jgi:hypothetical protein
MRANAKFVLFAMAALTVLVSGCGKYRKSTEAPATTEPTTPSDGTQTGTVPSTPGHTDPLDATAGVWGSGGSAVFTPVSNDMFNKWVGGNWVSPKNVLINVDLKRATNKSTYYGTVKIRYEQNGVAYEATLKSGSSTYDGKDFYMYNYWFNWNGKKVFSGFFDDKIGSIVLVVDQFLDLGDGGGVSEVSGEVWFKNYQISLAAYDEGGAWSVVMPCWFRSIGPYDCRSSSVIDKSGLYPTGNYEKLGEFSSMNKLKAFGE